MIAVRATHAVRSLLPLLVVPVFLSFLATALRAETPAPLIGPDALRADLRLARQVIVESHPGCHRYESPDELAAAFDRAERSADRPTDAWGFYRSVATAVASIRCAHTSVSLPETLQRDLDTTLPLLPLSVRVLHGRLYVFRDLADPAAALAGAEILSIAGIQTPKLLDTLYAALPRDGDVATSNAWRVSGLRLGTHIARVFGPRSTYPLVLRDRKGRILRRVLEGRPRPALTDSLTAKYPHDLPPTRALDVDFLNRGAIARLALHRFSERDSATLAALHQAVAAGFDSVRMHGSRALILDLRGNGGGDAGALRRLTGAFFRPPGPISIGWLESRGRLRALLAPPWPRERAFDGPLVVVVDSESASAAEVFARTIQLRGRGKVVGDRTGGAVMLARTHVRMQTRQQRLVAYAVSITEADVIMPDGSTLEKTGLTPDVVVLPSAADLRAHTDPMLARAVELAGAGLSSEAAARLLPPPPRD